MRNINQNLFFNAIMILVLGSAIWYFYSEQSKKNKFSILSHFTDLIFYFVVSALTINIVIHFEEIVLMPYRAIIFSSNVIANATFIIIAYAGITFGERLLEKPDKARSTIQLFLFISIVNHIYLYFIYSNIRSILFIGFFTLLLAITSTNYFTSKIDPLIIFLGAGIVHYFLMGDQAVLYFNFAYYKLPFIIYILTLTLILYLKRRKLKSNQI